MAGSFADLLVQFPRFDGKTDAESFIRKFIANMVIHEKDPQWAVVSFGHFLDGAARSWWTTVEEEYLERISKPRVDSDFLWKSIMTDLHEAFPSDELKSTAKQASRERKYQEGECVSDFIFAKLALLHNWKSNMDEDKRVKEILRSLPIDVSQTLVGNATSVQDLRRSLTSVMELRRLEKPAPKRNVPPDRTTPASNSSVDNNFAGSVTCHYCHSRGHYKRSCPRLLQDNPAESARLRQRRGEAPLRYFPQRAFESQPRQPSPALFGLPAPPQQHPPGSRQLALPAPASVSFVDVSENYHARGSGTTGH